MNFQNAVTRFDGLQQRHPVLGFPLAVRAKYSADQGGYLAATIAYYGFFSLFPLLLVFVTGLGYVLHGHPHLQTRIIGTALAQLPVVGPDLTQHSLKGNPGALAVGIAASLWTGTGVMIAAQAAMNRVWDVPTQERPGFLLARLRALGLLAVLGGGLLAATVISGIATAGASFGPGVRLGAFAASVLVNILLFWLAFRLLTPDEVSWRDLRGAGAGAALGYEALQLLGSYYVTHTLQKASNVYGTFALVIGLLSWIYLTATVLVLAAEGNVVATERLWPRSLRARVEPRPSD